VPEGGELPSDEELAAMEAQERGEPEAPATDQSHEPTLEETVAADVPAVELPALEELAAGEPEDARDEPEPTAEGEEVIEQAEAPASEAAGRTE
jgi:hypothetical protein